MSEDDTELEGTLDIEVVLELSEELARELWEELRGELELGILEKPTENLVFGLVVELMSELLVVLGLPDAFGEELEEALELVLEYELSRGVVMELESVDDVVLESVVAKREIVVEDIDGELDVELLAELLAELLDEATGVGESVVESVNTTELELEESVETDGVVAEGLDDTPLLEVSRVVDENDTISEVVGVVDEEELATSDVLELPTVVNILGTEGDSLELAVDNEDDSLVSVVVDSSIVAVVVLADDSKMVDELLVEDGNAKEVSVTVEDVSDVEESSLLDVTSLFELDGSDVRDDES